MKEAAGEANLTVVAIILIAVVVAIATPLVNSLMKTATRRACCTDAGLIWKDGSCSYSGSDSGGRSKEFWQCLNDNGLESEAVLKK